jgi:hypothetical protein
LLSPIISLEINAFGVKIAIAPLFGTVIQGKEGWAVGDQVFDGAIFFLKRRDALWAGFFRAAAWISASGLKAAFVRNLRHLAERPRAEITF